MKDPGKKRAPRSVRQLAEDFALNAPEFFRIHHMRAQSSRMFRDARFMRWLAAEARAVVNDGIESDPWSSTEVKALASRLRTAAILDRTGVQQIAGRPVCVPPPETDLRTGEALGATAGRPVPWVQLATAAGIGRELWDEDCDTWIEIPDDLPAGRYVALNVTGESMIPLLHDGDVVLVNMAADPRVGDVVLARTDHGYVVKRLGRMSSAGMTLESLNPEFEPMVIRDVTKPIAGTVVMRWCAHERSH